MKMSTRVFPGWIALCLVVAGCGPWDGGPSRDVGSYGAFREAAGTGGRAVVGTGGAEELPATTTNALLTVIQTELSPATLWHSRAERVTLFGNLPAYGLGGPTMLAYASPTGITSLKPGMSVEGAQIRENWLMAGFPGAEGWTNWDSPWAVFLQRRPAEVRLGTNGVEFTFAGAAGYFSLMPLYGYYKPPQKGRELLKAQGLKEKGLLTWEWPTVLARDPLTRLRYWAGVTRRFPVRCHDEIRVDRGRDTVVMRQRFDWVNVPDEWGTRAITLAPVSPTLGLVTGKGQTFPVSFSAGPFDFEIATPYGPYLGVLNTESYELEFPVLKYVNETEAPVVALPPDAPPVVRQALDRLRSVAREKFPAGDSYRHDHGGMENFCWAAMGDGWYAKALPYLEPAIRSNAVASLGKYLREDVLVAERFKEREFPAGSGRRYLILEGPGIGSWGVLGDAGKFSANLLQLIWAHAHYTGDHALVRERWPLIKRLFTTPAQTRWVGFGRDEIAELGDEAAPAIAYARLAYLAGDLAAYEFGCAMVARELVHLYAKQRGAAWVREQQPWHSMELIEEEVFLTHLWGDLAGWQIDGPRYPAGTRERQSDNRWVRFQDLDVARFYRDELGADVRRELKSLGERSDATWRFTDDSHIRPSLVRLNSLLLNASPTNLAMLASPEQFQGPPSGIMASALAMIRTSVKPKFERLIPGAPARGFGPGLDADVAAANSFLVQKVEWAGTNGPVTWPRIGWWGWKTPTGKPWTFGEVRAGEKSAPGSALVVTTLNWNSVRMEWK